MSFAEEWTKACLSFRAMAEKEYPMPENLPTYLMGPAMLIIHDLRQAYENGALKGWLENKNQQS